MTANWIKEVIAEKRTREQREAEALANTIAIWESDQSKYLRQALVRIGVPVTDDYPAVRFVGDIDTPFRRIALIDVDGVVFGYDANRSGGNNSLFLIFPKGTAYIDEDSEETTASGQWQRKVKCWGEYSCGTRTQLGTALCFAMENAMPHDETAEPGVYG